MARTRASRGSAGGATMFLVPADTPGIRVVRHIDTLDRSMIGGHCEVFFDDVWCRTTRCSARWTKGSATHRSGSGRRG